MFKLADLYKTMHMNGICNTTLRYISNLADFAAIYDCNKHVLVLRADPIWPTPMHVCSDKQLPIATISAAEARTCNMQLCKNFGFVTVQDTMQVFCSKSVLDLQNPAITIVDRNNRQVVCSLPLIVPADFVGYDGLQQLTKLSYLKVAYNTLPLNCTVDNEILLQNNVILRTALQHRELVRYVRMLAVSGYVHVTDDKCKYVKILCKLPKYLTEAMLKSSVALHLQNDCSTYAEFCAAFQQCTTAECSKIVKQAFEFAAKHHCSDIELHDIKYITGVVMQDKDLTACKLPSAKRVFELYYRAVCKPEHINAFIAKNQLR